MKAPVGRIGGKKFIKLRIINMFPNNYETLEYIEPFIGGGCVYYAKKPSAIEVINDIDPAMFQIHNGLKYYGEIIGKTLQETYTRECFNELKALKPISLKSQCIRSIILSKISYSSNQNVYNPGQNYIKGADYAPYQDRLKDTVVLNEDYKSVIEKYDSPNALFYLDPPYENSKSIHYDFPNVDYKEIATICKSLKGKFILSINDSPTVRELFKDFHIKEIVTRYRTPKGLKTATELIISNYL
jgi:DNA adenine methylase